ncbi:ABC transporter substrate-binding protein [Haloterrigena salifodinae]|uniref:ABC transporter substrate-binding protein n=1 Tax=Haloterrigena salifodinae TaxID=2675099 RepID=UPI001E47DD4C|nr:ABC transporter substrate-binding protein [Haloterrigena salifodinae]
MTNNNRGCASHIDRRAFLQVAGASSAVALAGCTGGNGTGDGTHVSYTNQVPTKIQYNPLNPTSYSQYSHYLLFDRFANFNFAKGEFIPYLIQDWEFGDGSFEMTVRDGVTWEDGDDVTAGDVATQLRLARLTGGTIDQFTDSVEVADDRTVVLELAGEVNPRIVEFNALGQRFMTLKESEFGEYVEMFEDDAEKAQSEIQSHAYKDVIANGPFTVSERGNQQILLEKRDDHPDSDNINFDRVAFRYLDGNTAVHQAIGADELDSVMVFAPPNVVNNFPDHIRMETIPGKVGYGLIPQHNHEHTGDRAVRQAIAHVLDRETIVKNVGETLKQAPPLPVGIPSDDQKRWLGDAYDSFEDYGVNERQTDDAEQILLDAGYSKDGDTWVDGSGNVVELPITVPSGWTDWVTATQTIVDQLNDFGFESQVDSRNFSALNGTVWPNGDFVLSAGGWLPGGGRASFPYFSLHHQLLEHYRGFTYNYTPANENRGGSNGDVTIPSRTGSGTMTVNPSDRLEELSETSDEATTREISIEQAWVTNVDLPVIPVMEKQEQAFLATDEWSVPEQGSDVSQVRWPHLWLIRQGELQYDG